MGGIRLDPGGEVCVELTGICRRYECTVVELLPLHHEPELVAGQRGLPNLAGTIAQTAGTRPCHSIVPARGSRKRTHHVLLERLLSCCRRFPGLCVV